MSDPSQNSKPKPTSLSARALEAEIIRLWGLGLSDGRTETFLRENHGVSRRRFQKARDEIRDRGVSLEHAQATVERTILRMEHVRGILQGRLNEILAKKDGKERNNIILNYTKQLTAIDCNIVKVAYITRQLPEPKKLSQGAIPVDYNVDDPQKVIDAHFREVESLGA